MCVAIPGKVVAIGRDGAEVEVNGITRTATTLFAPEVQVGDYVVLSGGAIIDRLSEEEALARLDLFENLEGVIDEQT